MTKTRIAIALAVAALAAPVAALGASHNPGHKTPTPQGNSYGKNCLANMPAGMTRGSAAYRAYFNPCVRAANQAAAAARKAGDAGSSSADKTRGADACTKQAAFAPPRKTAAKRAAFSACVKAAIAAQKATLGG
jgi:hypothetical protein